MVTLNMINPAQYEDFEAEILMWNVTKDLYFINVKKLQVRPSVFKPFKLCQYVISNAQDFVPDLLINEGFLWSIFCTLLYSHVAIYKYKF